MTYLAAGIALFPLLINWIDIASTGTPIPPHAYKMLTIGGGFVGGTNYLVYWWRFSRRLNQSDRSE